MYNIIYNKTISVSYYPARLEQATMHKEYEHVSGKQSQDRWLDMGGGKGVIRNRAAWNVRTFLRIPQGT